MKSTSTKLAPHLNANESNSEIPDFGPDESIIHIDAPYTRLAEVVKPKF
jgi:hypothetical protein